METVKKIFDKVKDTFWSFIDKNHIFIFFAIISVFALFLRIQLFDNTKGDYDLFLEPWFYELKTNGGLSALGLEIGNYNAPYMTILALLTYLPIPPVTSIKMVSVIFDFWCAITCMLITLTVLKNHKNKEKIALLVYGIVLFLPTVFLNSGYWAQSDSIYTAFVLTSLLFLIKQKYIRSFIFLGIAFSFKLQFIFILPLYILVYISERKISLWHFVIPIVTCLVMCVPSLICGNTINRCIDVYIGQIGTYDEYITLNFPNLYSIFFSSDSTLIKNPNEYLPKIGLSFTMICFGIIAFLVLNKKVKFDSRAIIEFGLWSILISTFFLPHMHERYLFMGDVLAIVYLLFNMRKYYIPIMIEIISCFGYIRLLFGGNALEPKYVGILYLVLIIIYSKDMYKRYFLDTDNNTLKYCEIEKNNI